MIALEEQETPVNLYPGQVSKTAEVYSCIPTTVKKLRKYAHDRPDCMRIVKDTGAEIFVEMDRSCIRIAPKRKLSDEQRRLATERLMRGQGVKT